jgi:hypothetical protein
VEEDEQQQGPAAAQQGAAAAQQGPAAQQQGAAADALLAAKRAAFEAIPRVDKELVAAAAAAPAAAGQVPMTPFEQKMEHGRELYR